MANTCPACHSDNPETSRFCAGCGAPLRPHGSQAPAVTETFQAPVHELTTGSIFAGRYQIIEELGRGGMGRVYRVLDQKLHEEVALKLIKPEIAADKETLKRFHNELRLARKMAHRNVGKMYELMEDQGTCFITMEYVRGEDLKSLIRMSRRLEVGTAISIAKQVCEGLAEAHRLGVVHRDLKPSNILIDKEGNARIMDFGIARSIQAKGITGTGIIIGTPEYMSPEQAEAKEVDQRSDIYSLGVILYEMLTGKVPFEGETALSIVVKHKTEEPKDPGDINPQIPDNLSLLVRTCLNKKPENRYGSVQKVAAELDLILAGVLQRGKKAPAGRGSSGAKRRRALSRDSLDLDQPSVSDDLAKIIASSQLSIKDDIVHVTFSRSDRVAAAINDIAKNISWDPDQVFYINQGGGEITLILDREKRALFQNILPQAAEMREKAAVIRIREIKVEDIVPGVEVPGLFAFFINQLSRLRINIWDVISTLSTLTLVIAEEDLVRAYSALSACIQHFRKRIIS